MTHAYDNILLERASDTLGRMLDYSVYSLHYDIPAIMNLFIASGTAADFERGDIRTICGMSGIELAYKVLEKSGIAYERSLPRYTKNLSAEYWYGFVLARIQWKTGVSFAQIIKSFSAQSFIAGYGKSRLSYLDSLPLNISEQERTEGIRSFGRKYASDSIMQYASPVSDEPALKKLRIKNGLSQSGLAEATGIPVRTIQQYEQGRKDIRKARAEYIIALAKALNCNESVLLR